MKVKILSMSSITPDEVTTMFNEQNGLQRFLQSIKENNLDHEILYKKTQFGGQLPVVVEWCEKNRNKYTHVCYSDAWDVIALGNMDELISKIPINFKFFGSAEKMVFPPNKEKQARYPDRGEWNYVNAGQWLAEIDFFLDVMVKQQHPQGHNDQEWLSDRYLECFEKGLPVCLDHSCNIFQSIAFENKGDFATTRDARVLNRKTNSLPILIHDNGNKHDPLIWVYEMLDRQCGWENDSMRKNHPESETMRNIRTS